jgi:hypothetical protein
LQGAAFACTLQIPLNHHNSLMSQPIGESLPSKILAIPDIGCIISFPEFSYLAEAVCQEGNSPTSAEFSYGPIDRATLVGRFSGHLRFST